MKIPGSLEAPRAHYAVRMNRDADRLQTSGAVDVWYQCVGEAEASRALDYLALLSEEER